MSAAVDYNFEYDFLLLSVVFAHFGETDCLACGKIVYVMHKCCYTSILSAAVRQFRRKKQKQWNLHVFEPEREIYMQCISNLSVVPFCMAETWNVYKFYLVSFTRNRNVRHP